MDAVNNLLQPDRISVSMDVVNNLLQPDRISLRVQSDLEQDSNYKMSKVSVTYVSHDVPQPQTSHADPCIASHSMLHTF